MHSEALQQHHAGEIASAALDILEDQIAVIDSSGQIVFVNAAWRRVEAVAGAPGGGSGVGSNYLEVCDRTAGSDAAVARSVAEGLRAVLQGQRDALVLEYPCAEPGGLRWVRLRAAPMTWGEALYVVVSHQDVTSRVRVEESLQSTEERYRLIWEATNDAMALSDPSGTVLDANLAYYRLYGGTPEEVIGASFSRIFPPEARAWAEASYRETFFTQPNGRLYESRVLAADGTDRVVESRIDFVDRAGARIGMLSVIRDITAHKSVEAQLREQESLFRLIFEQSPLGAALVGLDYRFLRVNQALCAMVGYSADELLQLGFPAITHPDDLASDVAQARQLAAGTIDRYTLEKRYIRKGGEVFWARLTGGALRGEDGATRFFLAQVEDITQQREDEAQRQKLEHQLQESQRLESIGLLAGGIAHDFNNMLTGIQGFTELAIEGLPEGHPARANLEQAQIGVRHVVDLTQQLLAYAGRGKISVRPLSLNSVIDEMDDLLRSAVARQCDLVFALAEGVPTIDADVAQIRQVILNLVTNAVESLAGQHGTVTVTTAASTLGREELDRMLLSETLAPGMYVSLAVSDTGCGMDAATVARIFDPFYTTKVTGRGLGLASVLGILRRHSAALAVQSAVGVGTVFRIVFPASSNQVTLRAPERRRERASATGTVLVIDDDVHVRAVITRMLQQIGYGSAIVESGEAGLALLAGGRSRVSVVLVDLTMPQTGGDVVARTIVDRFKGLPVVLMSGYSLKSIEEIAASIGLAGVLHKPFTQAELAAVLGSALGA